MKLIFAAVAVLTLAPAAASAQAKKPDGEFVVLSDTPGRLVGVNEQCLYSFEQDLQAGENHVDLRFTDPKCPVGSLRLQLTLPRLHDEWWGQAGVYRDGRVVVGPAGSQRLDPYVSWLPADQTPDGRTRITIISAQPK